MESSLSFDLIRVANDLETFLSEVNFSVSGAIESINADPIFCSELKTFACLDGSEQDEVTVVTMTKIRALDVGAVLIFLIIERVNAGFNGNFTVYLLQCLLILRLK